MAMLTIHRGPQRLTVSFDAPKKLDQLLPLAGIEAARPCGGRGLCGKCAVLLTGSVSAPGPAEEKCGARLACQAIVTGDAEVTLPEALPMQQIEGGRAGTLIPLQPAPGAIGAAVDIGTTTLALSLHDLHSGACLGRAAMLNPQTSVAADVIGRIGAALNGQSGALQHSVQSALHTLLLQACAGAGIPVSEVGSLVIAGNTTMLYLLTGRDPASLSRAPFEADCLFGEAHSLQGRTAYLPRCIHAFVGADATCALLSCSVCDQKETALLMDVGTNGEIALWHEGRLYAASTAAGPAFEGAGIRCGCSSVVGAIDRVDPAGNGLAVHTIGGSRAVGLCGSGLVDTIAALLDMGIIDETGAMDDEEVVLAEGVVLTRKDVRAVQLAKAAIAACVRSLLRAAGCSMAQVRRVYVAGGFGSHLRIDRAARIGLIPQELADRVEAVGNAALDGAAMLLMDTPARERLATLADSAIHVRLDGDPTFSAQYVEEMFFPEE